MKTKQKTNGKVEILIAEDSPTQSAQLAHVLEQHGYTVTTAANGREALALLARHKPAMVISDIVMPELDGYGLCKAIKADQTLKNIPVMLVTTLSDPNDVIRGLECGADNFLRKPYEERYLLSRIDYLLMNTELRKNQKMQMGMEIRLGGQTHFISSDRQQILDLLISTYEQAVEINSELKQREQELVQSNELLNALYRIAEGLNQTGSEREVAEMVLERALELPGVRAGWIQILGDDSNFRTLASRNLPPALCEADAFDGSCVCQRRLLEGKLDHVVNILECERLGRAKGDTQELRYHASVPLWLGEGHALGMMNLVGPDKGLFSEEELKVLYNVGNQVAVAMQRAHLQEHLERLVEERTAALELSERWFRGVFNSQQDAVLVTSPDGAIINANTAAERTFGYSVAELKGRSPSLLHLDEQRYIEISNRVKQSLAQGTVAQFEYCLKRKSGEIFPTEHTLSPLKDDTGKAEGVVRVIRDISVRKEHEARITRLNRVYAVLSGINTTIVRTRDRQELFEDACRIAVELGKFRLAWIGLLDANGLDVTPVARAGVDEGYLDNIQLTARDGAPDRCEIVAQAVREKTAVVCNDINTDQRMARWREEALRRGYRSVAVLPLQLEDEVMGLLLLYASDTGFFDIEEMRLLTEIAGDISFALDHINKQARLDYLAYYDVLTGLANRNLFLERVAQHLRGAASEERKLALYLIDLERFKNINDSLGRPAGDALLRQVAEWLKRNARDASLLARVGADHFALVMPEVRPGGDLARLLEQSIKAFLEHPFRLNDAVFRIAAKVGVALFPDDGGDADTLLRNAEAALKNAKASGERYLFYTQKMTDAVAGKLSLENQLRQALDNDEFVLHYQPKVDLASGKMTGAEALIRWNDPRTGLVPPGRFIPILEETGLIQDVGRWALKQAIADYLRWRAAGLPAVRIAVNVSPLQLRHRDFIAEIGQVIGIDAQAAAGLEIEITESVIMEDVKGTIASLQAVRALDVCIAIDDFGTGFSSLSYLAKLPVHTLKIDRSFVIEMTTGPEGLALVSTIINLAHSLKLKVVAEGVETEEQSRLLQLLSCDEMQGYLFSKPVPAEIFETRFLAPPPAG